MSVQTNLGGKTITVDRVDEIFDSSTYSSPTLSLLKSSIANSKSQRDIDAIKKELEDATSDGKIIASEKKGLKREWYSLLSAWSSVNNIYANSEDLKDWPSYVTLKSTMESLTALMDKVFADMDSTYEEDDVSAITESVLSAWTLIDKCNTYNIEAGALQDRHKLEVTGDYYIIDKQTMKAKLYLYENGSFNDVTDSTAYSDSEFKWYDPDNPDAVIATGRTCTIPLSLMNKTTPKQFVLEFEHNYYGVLPSKDDANVRVQTFFNLYFGTLIQYAYSDASTIEELMKDSYLSWTTEVRDNENGKLYLWRRESSDLGTDSSSRDWSYFRETGAQGDTGWSQATVTLYKRSADEQTGYDGEELTYYFSTGGITGSTGTWSRTVPSGDEKLWVISASAFANSSSDPIEITDWTSPAVLSENGTVGQDGYTVLTVLLYQRGKTKPDKPAGKATYYFDSNTITGVEPWSITVPSGTDPVWVTSATAATRTEVYDSIDADEWSEPQILVQNGDDGISSYTYIRYSDDNGATFTANGGTVIGDYMGVCITESSTAPADVYAYTWSKIKGEKGDTGNKGDSISISAVNIQYANSSSGTSTPSDSAWADSPSPVKGQYLWTKTYVKYSDGTENISYSVAYIGSDGQDGTSPKLTGQTVEYQNSASGASVPTGSWSTTASPVNGQYTWTRTTLVYSDGTKAYTYSVSYTANDGKQGDPAPYTRSIYTASAQKPAKPEGTGDQVPSGWSTAIPVRTAEQVHWISMSIISVENGEYVYGTWSEPAKYTAEESGIVPIVQWMWGASDTIRPDEEETTVSLGDDIVLEVNGQAVTLSTNSTEWSDTIPDYSDEKPYLWKREWRYASEGQDAGWLYYCVTGKQGVEGSYNSLGYKIDGATITFAGLDRDGEPTLASFRANLGGEVVAFQRTYFTISNDLDGNFHDRYFLVAHWTSTVGTLSLCYITPVSETDSEGTTTYRMKWVDQDGDEITTTSVDGTAYDPYVLADIRMASGYTIKSVTLVNPAKLKSYESDYFMSIMSQGDMDDINTVAKALDVERVFERVAALEAFINKLFANEITISNTLDNNGSISKYGSIHSSGYNKLDYTDETKRGFYLESTGYAEFSKAILKDASIESRDSDNLPILATSTSYDQMSISFNDEVTHWKLDDLLANVDINTYGNVTFSSDYEAIFATTTEKYLINKPLINKRPVSTSVSSVSFEYEFTVDFSISKIELSLYHEFSEVANSSSLNDTGIYVNDVLASTGQWNIGTTQKTGSYTDSSTFPPSHWTYYYYEANATLTTGGITAGSKIKIKINITTGNGDKMRTALDQIMIYVSPYNFEGLEGADSDCTTASSGYIFLQKEADNISLYSKYIYAYYPPKEHRLVIDGYDSDTYVLYRPIDNGIKTKIYDQLSKYVVYKCDSTTSYIIYDNKTTSVDTITCEEDSVIINSAVIIPYNTPYPYSANIDIPQGEGVLTTKTIFPAASNRYDLGSENAKFRNIYAENLYPVGSFYFSTRPTSPASMYGGTWVELDGNRTLWFTSHTDGTTTAYLEDGTGDEVRPQKIAGSLPNLYGWFVTQGNDNSSTTRAGCDGKLFSKKYIGTVDSGTSSASDYANGFTFDASDYNSIYTRNSSIVRPTSYMVYAWWRKA